MMLHGMPALENKVICGYTGYTLQAFVKHYESTIFPPFLYARLKNGRIMLYPSASVRPSVRLSVRPPVNFFVSV